MNFSDVLLTFAIFTLGLYLEYILVNKNSWYVLLGKRALQLRDRKNEKNYKHDACLCNLKRNIFLILYLIFVMIMLSISWIWYNFAPSFCSGNFLDGIKIAIWLAEWVLIYFSSMAVYPWFKSYLIEDWSFEDVDGGAKVGEKMHLSTKIISAFILGFLIVIPFIFMAIKS